MALEEISRPDPPVTNAACVPAPRWSRARCACAVCGVHVMAQVGSTVVGQCPNCHACDLIVIEVIDSTGRSTPAESLTFDWPSSVANATTGAG
jgi:hypothetical protein